MNDLGDRADDYERRLNAAASTGDIINGLVRSSQKSHKIVKYLTISIVCDVIFSVALCVVALLTRANALSADQRAEIACEQSIKTSIVANELLKELIENVKKGTTLNSTEKLERVARYNDLTVVIQDCSKK